MSEHIMHYPSEEELKKLIADEIEKVSNLPQADIHLLKTLYSCMDLTSLNSTDGPGSIDKWLDKAVF